MERFIWKDEYSVKIPLVDQQHKRFFEITNRMIGLSKKNSDAAELIWIIEELKDHARHHFSTEESHFAKFTFEKSEQHLKAHDRYRQRIEGYLAAAHDPAVDLKKLVKEVAEYSAYWLSDHILIMDRNIPYSLKDKKPST